MAVVPVFKVNVLESSDDVKLAEPKLGADTAAQDGTPATIVNTLPLVPANISPNVFVALM